MPDRRRLFCLLSKVACCSMDPSIIAMLSRRPIKYRMKDPSFGGYQRANVLQKMEKILNLVGLRLCRYLSLSGYKPETRPYMPSLVLAIIRKSLSVVIQRENDDRPALPRPGVPVCRHLVARLSAPRGRPDAPAAAARHAAPDLLLRGPLRAARGPGGR